MIKAKSIIGSLSILPDGIIIQAPLFHVKRNKDGQALKGAVKYEDQLGSLGPISKPWLRSRIKMD